MTTSEHSKEQSLDQLTLLPEGSLAKAYPSLGSAEARMMTVGSGLKCCASSPRQGRVMSWLRTLAASSRWGSTRSYLIWSARVTKQGRLYFRLAPWVPSTFGNAPGYLPTPQASDNRDRGNMSNPSIRRRQEIGKQLNLSMVVKDRPGQLNPEMIGWMMGYPPMWTDV